MHYTTLTTLFLAALSGTTVADNCFAGYYYCSGNLMTQGNYHNTIVATLNAAGQGTDQATIDRALFICLTEGELEYSTLCDGACVNEAFGSQNHDHC